MVALARPTPRGALRVVTTVGAVHVPVVAVPAEVKQPPAVVKAAEKLSKIVHSREGPPRISPPRQTRATTLSSNASTRGDPGLGADDSGPYLLVRSS